MSKLPPMDLNDEFICSTIGVRISEFSEKYIDRKTVTFYKVDVINHYSKTNWSLEKRYSEFEALYRVLLKLLPNVPNIPGKSLFKVSSFDALSKRQFELEQFLKECVVRKDILSNTQFKEFLEIEKHSPELIMNAPVKVADHQGIPLGVRDFHYSEDDEAIFMCCSDMNIVSRADSMLTNLNFPWEKKSDSHVPVGAVFVFKINKSKTNEFEFVKTWAKSFPIQTGILLWDRESSTLSVGLDDGTIVFYKHQLNSKYTEFDELCQIKPHKGRVMGIGFDVNSGYIYSCSSDKTFIVSEINYQSSVNELSRGKDGYTNLVFDKSNDRIFLTTEGGDLSVYLTSSNPPIEVLNISTSSKGSIRGLHIAYKKFLIFTANVLGTICVCDLNLPGKEKLINEISSFGGKSKLRIIRYISRTNEVITGDEEGRVTIWSLKDGQSIYAWLAHPKSAITQMYYQEEKRLLWTGGKDKAIRIWELPEKWVNDEIEKFEETEIKNINNNIAMLKMQKTMAQREEDDSDSSLDDLNGWDFK